MMYSSLTIDYIYVGFDSTYRGVLIRFSARLVSSVAIANANIGDRYRKACVNPFANVSSMVVPFYSAFTIVDVSFAKSSCAQSDYSTQCLRSTFVISERIDADRDASPARSRIFSEYARILSSLSLFIVAPFVGCQRCRPQRGRFMNIKNGFDAAYDFDSFVATIAGKRGDEQPITVVIVSKYGFNTIHSLIAMAADELVDDVGHDHTPSCSMIWLTKSTLILSSNAISTGFIRCSRPSMTAARMRSYSL